MLKRFKGNRHIRPLLDEIEEPPALVLKFLHDNLLSASNTRRLERSELRFVARGVLEALNVIHEAGYVHTGMMRPSASSTNDLVADWILADIKPNNILANYGDDGGNRFSEVELGDCEDIYRVDPNADVFEEGHIIGAAIFRSPEANLQLRWGTPTDIWSFGATVRSFRWHTALTRQPCDWFQNTSTAHKSHIWSKLAYLCTQRSFRWWWGVPRPGADQASIHVWAFSS